MRNENTLTEESKKNSNTESEVNNSVNEELYSPMDILEFFKSKNIVGIDTFMINEAFVQNRALDNYGKFNENEFNKCFDLVKEDILNTYWEFVKSGKKKVSLSKLSSKVMEKYLETTDTKMLISDKNNSYIYAIKYLEKYPNKLAAMIVKNLKFSYYYNFDKNPMYPYQIYLPTHKHSHKFSGKCSVLINNRFVVILLLCILMSYVNLITTKISITPLVFGNLLKHSAFIALGYTPAYGLIIYYCLNWFDQNYKRYINQEII